MARIKYSQVVSLAVKKLFLDPLHRRLSVVVFIIQAGNIAEKANSVLSKEYEGATRRVARLGRRSAGKKSCLG